MPQNLVILAGGAGTRMAGGAGPKHLLEVDEAPLLLSSVDQVVREFGIQRIVYRVAFQAERFVSAWFAGALRPHLKSNVLVGRLGEGPIGALLDSAQLIGPQTILFTSGDVFFKVDSFASMLAYHVSHDAPITVGAAHSIPSTRPSTLVADAGGTLLRYERKERTDDTDLLNAGVYLVDSGSIDWLVDDWRRATALAPSREYKEDHLWCLIQGRPDRGRIFVLPGMMINVNSVDQLEAARELAHMSSCGVMGAARPVGRAC